MESNDLHWTKNDDLMESFLLNRLNPEERNELEDHLRICEVCKQEVRAQKLLIAGIRRGGREAFKARLREKVGLLPEKRIPWPHVLSAAAVIVILVSVGVYNRWFETVQQPENTVVLLHPDAAPPVVSKEPATEDTRSEAEMSVEEKPIPTDDRPLEMSKRTKERKAPASTGMSNAAEEEKSKTMERSKSAQGAGAVASHPESVQEIQADILVAEPEILWAEGTVLSSEEGLVQKRKSEEQGIPNAVRQFGKADAMKATPSTAQRQAAKEQSLLVAQRSTAFLPLNQQQIRQENKVLTKVERLGEQIQFTVYLDSLLEESDLARTTIEQAGNDSVIVNLRIVRRFLSHPGQTAQP